MTIEMCGVYAHGSSEPYLVFSLVHLEFWVKVSRQNARWYPKSHVDTFWRIRCDAHNWERVEKLARVPGCEQKY